MPRGHDPAHIRKLFAYRDQYGLTWAELSEHSGIPSSTLASWARRLKQRSRFVEVTVDEDYVSASPPLTLELPSGLRLHIPATFQEESLVRLLRALGC